MTPDPILDDLFYGVIWSAFIIEARAAGTWPDPEKVRQRAYATYEAEKRATPPPGRSP
jgi:hypothetical protein